MFKEGTYCYYATLYSYNHPISIQQQFDNRVNQQPSTEVFLHMHHTKYPFLQQESMILSFIHFPLFYSVSSSYCDEQWACEGYTLIVYICNIKYVAE